MAAMILEGGVEGTSLVRELNLRTGAGRPGLELGLSVSAGFRQVDRIRGSAEPKLHSVVPGHKARPHLAGLFLNEIASVISEPDICCGGSRQDHELMVTGLFLG